MKFYTKILVPLLLVTFMLPFSTRAEKVTTAQKVSDLIAIVKQKKNGSLRLNDRIFQTFETDNGLLTYFGDYFIFIDKNLTKSYMSQIDGALDRFISIPKGRQAENTYSAKKNPPENTDILNLFFASQRDLSTRLEISQTYEGLGVYINKITSVMKPGVTSSTKGVSSSDRESINMSYFNRLDSLWSLYYSSDEKKDTNLSDEKDISTDNNTNNNQKDTNTEGKKTPVESINFNITSTIKLQNTDEKNYTGQWGISVKGTASRKDSKKSNSLQLVLHENGSLKNYIDLCTYEAGKIGSKTSIDTKTCRDQKEFIVVDWLLPGKQYDIYLAGDLKGAPVSNTISVPSGQIKAPIIAPNISVSSVSPKQKGTKKYFEVHFDVNKTKKLSTGKPDRISVEIYDINNKSVGSLGGLVYSEAKNAVLPQSVVDLKNFGNIISGSKYTVHFLDSQKKDIITPHAISNTNFGSSENSETSGLSGGITYSESEQKTINDVKSGGLVGSDRCGYGLANPNNRMCGFNDFMWMINNIISYIIILILPIAALVFAYAGYLYLTSGGNSNKRTAAKKAMTNLVIGVLIILCAWVVVRVVLVSLGVTDEFFIFFAK